METTNHVGAAGQPTPVALMSRPGGPLTAKVALVRPPVDILVKSMSMLGPMPPIGIAYIAAALRQVGHTVQVIDAAGEALEQLEEYETCVGTMRRIGLTTTETVARIEPGTQVIGLTHMFMHEWPVVKELAEQARARFPDATIVVGGENATNFWPWMFEQTDAIDCCVRGEGEATACELVSRVAQGLPYHEMAGLAVRRTPDGETVETGLPVRMRKLGEVARPAWDLFPMDNYLRHRSFLGVDRGRSMPMLASRGCPYKCTFCSSPQMWTTRYNVRDPEDIADEIAEHVERYGVKNIDFVDLTAVTKRQWTLDFCDALEARNLDISWQLPIGTRSEGIDDVVIRRMWESGCRNITFAPESGSPRMLEIFDKRLDLDHIIDDIRHARALGMVVHVNTIIGHPKENWHDRWLNWKFLVRAAVAGADTGSAIMFHPYPGSKDFDDLLAAGKIEVDDTLYFDGLARGAPAHHSWNEGISSRNLYLCQVVMMLTFFGLSNLLHPRRLVHLVRAVFFGGAEENFSEQALRTKLQGPMSAKRQSRTERATASVASVPSGDRGPETNVA
ncbi:MAG: Radical domain protein [Acidimicrobiales bacterium]|nr:Radical domain protein [Acidimicrobiales bacterium]